MAVLAVAAARPFWVFGGSSFKRGDVDVVVAIDASASMWVQDLGASRLELAVREVLNLYTLDILTPGDRVALFVFGTTALRQVHMSSNAERFIEQVGQVAAARCRSRATRSPGTATWPRRSSTSTSRWTTRTASRAATRTGSRRSVPTGLVLLLTDGDFAADAEQLARLDEALTEFRRRGLTVYPVAIGSRTGVELDIVLQEYVRGVDYDETLEADLEGIRTVLNTDGLGMLETRLGGSSFIIDSAGLSADSFLQNVINSHRSVTFQLIPAEDTQEIWQWVVTLAVVLFVVAMLFY